ncbi:MAG: superoxide dismutase [Methanomicrobiaceae archaeon]|nr:superoxide dismutase [Methanomicrobiaceae archaeon]
METTGRRGVDETMEEKKMYSLPPLPYDNTALAPHISEEQLRIHHDKHHQAYVTAANAILEKLDKAREEGGDLDMKATLKELSWNVGGHNLHSLFWPNMAPEGKGGGGEPGGGLADAIAEEYGSFDRFSSMFTKTAMSIEGSGWAALSFCPKTRRPLIMQIEKHNVNIYPTYSILMVLDAFEHAYYIDYKNEKAKFFDAFWKIVNWDEVNRRFEAAAAL